MHINQNIQEFSIRLGLSKEMSYLYRILVQAHCRVEEEEMMETLGNVLIF